MTTTPSRTEPVPANRTGALIAVLAGAAFVMILNETVLSVALRDLSVDLGVPATTTQWLTSGFLLTMAVVIPTTGYLLDRFTPRQVFLASLGLFTAATGLLLFSTLGPGTPLGVVVGFHLVLMGGLALMMTPLMTEALGSLPDELYSHGSAILSTLQQVAGALGTALFVTVAALGSASAAGASPDADGLHAAFAVAGGVGVLAVVLSLLVRRRTVAEAPVS